MSTILLCDYFACRSNCGS